MTPNKPGWTKSAAGNRNIRKPHRELPVSDRRMRIEVRWYACNEATGGEDKATALDVLANRRGVVYGDRPFEDASDLFKPFVWPGQANKI